MSVSPYAIPSPALQREVKRRRSFAIISHPDAGKTTLTEKFLLYGGALNLAGSVTARKNQRATTSDWMDLEKQRGISVEYLKALPVDYLKIDGSFVRGVVNDRIDLTVVSGRAKLVERSCSPPLAGGGSWIQSSC